MKTRLVGFKSMFSLEIRAISPVDHRIFTFYAYQLRLHYVLNHESKNKNYKPILKSAFQLAIAFLYISGYISNKNDKTAIQLHKSVNCFLRILLTQNGLMRLYASAVLPNYKVGLFYSVLLAN